MSGPSKDPESEPAGNLWPQADGERSEGERGGRSDAELMELIETGRRDRSAAWSELLRTAPPIRPGYARNLAGESIAADLVSEASKDPGSARRDKSPRELSVPICSRDPAHVDHRGEAAGGPARRHARWRPPADVAARGLPFDATRRAVPRRAGRGWRRCCGTRRSPRALDRVAKDLGMNANSVAALSFRAREGLHGPTSLNTDAHARSGMPSCPGAPRPLPAR